MSMETNRRDCFVINMIVPIPLTDCSKRYIDMNLKYIYIVFTEAVLKVESDGTDTIIYEGQYISDFAIHNGKKYIGTWEYLLIE